MRKLNGFRTSLGLVPVVCAVLASRAGAQQITLFTENFDELAGVLQNSVDEPPPVANVWTKTPPAGWTEDYTGMPGYGDPANDGTTEFAGWTFVQPQWWVFEAGDQNRSQFTKGTGVIAVADPDEWDDRNHNGWTAAAPYYNALLTSPAITIPGGSAANSLTLTFDSSWRWEGFDDGDGTNNQTAIVTISYDGGPEIEVLHWDSNETGIYWKPDATNESVSLPLNNPAGAASAKLTFKLVQARNDWWWAIDNILVKNPSATLYSENFDELALTPVVEANTFPTQVWTPNPPANWTLDRSGVPGVGDPNIGMTEWEGWNFAKAYWWAQVAGNQRRAEFASVASFDNIAAIADPDTWDDRGSPKSLGKFNTFLATPSIPVGPVGANTVHIKFKSSWRPECCDDGDHTNNQTATITASYDGGAPVEVMHWSSNPADATFHAAAPNEVVDIALGNPLGAGNVVISFGLTNAADDWWWAIDDIEVSGELAADTIKLLVENFDEIPLGPCVEEGCPTGPANVWTSTPPAGWSVDRTGVADIGVPGKGVTEWKGWNFARPEWWSFVAEDQGRSQFTKGTGVVAIADGDEWDDKGKPSADGTDDTFLSSPSISIAGAAAGTLNLSFDSAWQYEGNQTATITVAYDGAPPVQVLKWESDTASPFFHGDGVNESISVPLNNPAGASNMVLKFGYTRAGNNWYWAIDNIQVNGATGTVFSENFDGLTLGLPVDEKPFPPAAVWSETPPAGWSVDDTHVPGRYNNDPDPTLKGNNGVLDWAGWAFAQPAWWVTIAGDQDRSQFTKGVGKIAIADPDEWDDQAHPPAADAFPQEPGYYALMSTPVVNIKGVQPRDLYISFDSSWKSDDAGNTQTAVIRVSYDGAPPIEVVRWTSLTDPPGPFYKPNAINESVLIPLANPRANTAQVTFGLIEANNEWWWAIDNLVMFALKPGHDPAFDFDGDGDVDQADFGVIQACFDPNTTLTAASPAPCLAADFDLNLLVDHADLDRFFACVSGPSIPANPGCDD